MEDENERKVKEVWVCPESKYDLLKLPKYEDIVWCTIIFFDNADFELSDKPPTEEQKKEAYKKLNCRG